MAEGATRASRAPQQSAGLPVYIPGDKPREVWAHFASGVAVKAVQGRVRAYPGLRAEAPPTQAFYAALTKIGKGTHVIDVGAGAGSGTQLLSESFDRVTAVECDSHAIAFAKELAPLAHFVQADATRAYQADAAEFAIVVDVLGHVQDPLSLLTRVRALLGSEGTLLVAEPAAYVAQRLSIPARRAYSPRALSALLACAGFQVGSSLCDTGTFTAFLAQPARDAATDALVESVAYAARREAEAALEALAKARLSERYDVRREAELVEARLRLERGEGDAAARALFRAREADPADSRPLAGLSRLALLTGAHGDALRMALEAARLEPTDPSAAVAVALAADELGHRDAFDAWRLAHGLCPDDAAVATELARTASERHDYAFGIAVLERLRHYTTRMDPALHLTLAWLLLAEGRTRDAAIEARVVTALMPNDAAVEELWNALDQAGNPVGRS